MMRWFCSLIMLAMLSSPGQMFGQWQAEFADGELQIQSEVSADKIASAITALHAHRQRIAQTLDIRIQQRPTQILVFASASSYRAYVRPRVPEGVNRRALYVQGPDTDWVYVIYGKNWETDLRHEMTHANLHSSLPFLPVWLDEGLAEYFETTAPQQGLQPKYISSLKWRFRLRHSVRSDELEQLTDLPSFKAEHYRDSWAWVYFCLQHSAQTRTVLQEYLQAIQAEQVPGRFFAWLHERAPESSIQIKEFIRQL